MTKAATKPAAVVPAKAAAPASASDTIWVRTTQGVKRRCRAGLVFGEAPVAVPVDELSQDQLDAIEADPLLTEVDAPVADAEAVKTTEAAE